ncbi:MAG TPA: ABC transporter permease [Acidimicrobiales bacterium]|nr:ABC transporter permease [Acidimicrobiales bacterium]
MLGFLLRRLALSVPLFLLVSLLTFVTVAFIPGDPAVRILGAGHTLAEYHAFDVKIGLTEPVLVQYWHWLDRLLHGSLGSSLFTYQSVAAQLDQRLPVTLSLVLGATLVSLVLGTSLGVAAALWRGPIARLIDVVTWAGFAVPNFWLGLVLVELFAVRAHLLPASGYVSFSQSPGDWARSLVLPVLTLAAAGTTGIAKQTRNAMTEAMSREYVTALRLAGVRRPAIVFRHALRNAALTIVTVAGLFFVAMLGGTILVENVFVLPGLGGLAVQAATDHDLPVIEGVVVYFTLIVIAVNILIDLSYAWLNPRVRVSS